MLGIQPPNDILINYAIGLIVLLVGRLVRRGAPPLHGPADRRRDRRRQAEIAAAEKAVATGRGERRTVGGARRPPTLSTLAIIETPLSRR